VDVAIGGANDGRFGYVIFFGFFGKGSDFILHRFFIKNIISHLHVIVIILRLSLTKKIKQP